MPRRVKILFLAANPTDSTRLRLDEEVREIDHALQLSEHGGEFELIQHWAVRVSDLQGLILRHKPDVVHFSGHGSDSSEIILEDKTGKTHPVPYEALSNLFFIFKESISCVILNACYSENQANAIAEHINYVIGMSKAITDQSALTFSTAFYQAIGYWMDIRTSFDLACNQINLENLNEFEVPKLLVKDEPLPQPLTKRKKSSRKSTFHPAPSNHLRIDSGDTFLRNELGPIVRSYQNLPWYKSLSILMIDIDGLTIINNNYGITVGDKVLETVASIILSETESEHCGRCGEDTFYAILLGTDIEFAWKIAGRLKTIIRRYHWSRIAAKLYVSCSVGIAQLYGDEDVRDLIVRASIGLQEAKQSGPGKVVKGPENIPIKQSRELRDYYS